MSREQMETSISDMGGMSFGTVSVEYSESVGTASDGDLWPSTWADDGFLYAANGDGAGFSGGDFSDIVINRIEGHPDSGLHGERLADARDVSPVWGDEALFNCKPTGMVAVDGNGDGRDELYLAVQDLPYGETPETFNHAPTASIVRSDDYGRSWHATAQPMFTDHVFTTVMFLDFGQSNRRSRVLGPDNADYVYAYGLDGNWRTSYDQSVPDPVQLYLARAPIAHIQEAARWEYFTGCGEDAEPRWAKDASRRQSVLVDRRRVYTGNDEMGSAAGHSVLAQGGIVYNEPLNCYLYTSWTEFTFQFYVAPQPWGPWRLFHEQDFGPYPWDGPRSSIARHGGYATTVPSKFISADGRDMWLQSNWFIGSDMHTGTTYRFSLRRFRIEPLKRGAAENPPSAAVNLADPSTGVAALASMVHRGQIGVLNDGDRVISEDSWNGQSRERDVWGYTWTRNYRIDTLVMTTGPRDYTGGWFAEPPHVEVLREGTWSEVLGVCSAPAYPCDSTATGHRTYELSFPIVEGNGIRLVGPAGGFRHFTALSELEVYYRGA